MPVPTILTATADGLTLHWDSPSLTLERAATATLRPTLPGWPMAPAEHGPLPYATALVVLPSTGAVTLTVRTHHESTRILRTPLISATSPTTPPLWELPGLPAAGVTLTEIGVLRGVRLGQLTFVPLAYDPLTQQLTHLHTVEVILDFAEPLPAVGALEPFHAALQSLVVNPQQLYGYPRPARPTTNTIAAPDAMPMAQFRIEQRGLFALSWDTLLTAGIVTPTSDPAYVRLLRPANNTEVALHWNAAANHFLFYADPRPTRWATFEYYRAIYGPTPGLRMAAHTASATALPTGIAWAETLAEAQRAYESRYPSPRNGDHWYWLCLERPTSAACVTEAALPLPLETPDGQHPDAELTLWLYSYTNPPGAPNHRLAASMNGTPIGEQTWQSDGGRTLTFTVPTASLLAGNNTLQLTLPGLPDIPIEGLWLDAVRLRYPLMAVNGAAIHFISESNPAQYMLEGLPMDALLFDVSDPDAPIRLPPGFPLREDRPGVHHYFAAAPTAIQTLTSWELRPPLTEPLGAEYLALAPTALLPALTPLLDFHAARGLSVFAAPTEALYAHYGDGRMAPEALRDFVAHAYATWDPQPRYLLLVGDGTWDPLDHLGTGSPTLLPPYLHYGDPWLGEIPADNRYATVDGDDALPDLAVGRLPVNTPEELSAVIEKIITYAETPFPGDWNTHHLFVADDPDPAGNFPAEAEIVTAYVPISHTVTRLYCTNAPDDLYACDNFSDIRTGVLQGWNSGALVINWVGHSAFQQWEHGRLFHTDDLPGLARAPRYPLSLAMSCFTGNFAHPDPNMTSIDEALVRLPRGGAIAAFGNSGLGLGSSQTPLHRAFYLSALRSDAPAPPGVAASVAKAAVIQSVGRHLADTYHFFGDPALPLAWETPTWVTQLYLPLVMK